MTKKCQMEIRRENNNRKYIIHVSVAVLVIAVLCYFRILFALAIITYGLGCLACYLAIESNVHASLFEKLKLYYENSKNEVVLEVFEGCVTCGSKACQRHNGGAQLEPWVGLKIHKQLDQAIEDFYNTILDHFISVWYNKITLQPFFVDELRHQLRYASACLLRRAIKINYSKLITERLIPCALHHYTLCADLPSGSQVLDGKLAVHPAAANRNAELKYLRSITNAIMPYLLKSSDVENSVFRVLVREIFAGWVLLSLTDVLADPYILNTLIVLATGDETMAQLPTTPNYKVEFLETFARQSDSVYTRRSKLLRVDLDQVLDDQEMFYAFMQHLKTTNHLHLLQFYKDIKSFQTKLLNPVLCETEQKSILKEAYDIYMTYFDVSSPTRIPLDESLVGEMKTLLKDEDASVKKLQTSKALYQAARLTHAALEKIMLPRFLHSEEFYKLFVGSRIPTGYNKHMARKPQDRLMHAALRLGTKLKGALKTQVIDGQVLDTVNDDLSDEGENLDILKYLDQLAAEDGNEQNLSSYKVVLTDVEIAVQPPPRRGTVRVFTMAVHRAIQSLPPTLLTVRRTEHDFHLLNSKLHEFHGHIELRPLPSRRDNSPLETLRYKYEDYLQQLLQQSILQTSELLHLFLTVETDFSLAVQASTLASGTDLINIYQSVAHRLKKEKGQHLESFLRNFLVSSDMDRYQALKQGNAQIEEALEMCEEVEPLRASPNTRSSNVRDITTGTFGNNFGIEPTVFVRGPIQNNVVGFTQCFMYLLTKIVKLRTVIAYLFGSVLSMGKDVIDNAFNATLDTTLRRLLCERRLAHLIRLGHEVLFGKRSTPPRVDPTEQKEVARTQLLSSIPGPLMTAAGPGLVQALNTALDIIQRPELNKQLVYELLDLCIAELFPELLKTEDNTR